MNKINTYKIFCTGCGLCNDVNKVEFYTDEKGFRYPKLSEDDISFCEKVCPAGGNNISSSKVWGFKENIYWGWSSSTKIRHEASSGGILTSLCVWMLHNKIVDGIIQVRCSEKCIYETETVISRTKEEVLECMGSRYSISSPLQNISKLIRDDEKYVFIGKPCDVATLRSYMQIDEKIQKQIIYVFSFFCAGEPSNEAQKRLIQELGCVQDECKSLRYRGDGWPGNATIETVDKKIYSMSYEKSWGKILGRDIRYICKFCMDGIGLSADISCGDAWYLDKNKKPDFSENSGRNVIFARTERGKKLLDMVCESKEIELQDADEKELYYMQKYQFERRTTMLSKLVAMKLCRKSIPKYPIKVMLRLALNVSIRVHASIFKGTIKRCKEKRL